MEETTLLTIIKTSTDEKKKKQLHKSILSKRKRLTQLITKNELLKVELEMVKQEYDVRVGSLYLKDNQLDLQIIHYKNILFLMEDGLTFDKAVERLSETFYAEQLVMDREQEKIRIEEEIVEKRKKQADQNNSIDIKKLWKGLIARFHPDLVQDPVEKKKREEVIKLVNRAYEEHDYDQMMRLENNAQIDANEETTYEKLEEILVMIENEIIQQMMLAEQQKISEWFGWRKKLAVAKKKNIDIFADIERKLLDDIVKKFAILRSVKLEVEQRDKQNKITTSS